MKQSLEKLQNYFTLEAGRDYDNKAVMGGLASMLGLYLPLTRRQQLLSPATPSPFQGEGKCELASMG